MGDGTQRAPVLNRLREIWAAGGTALGVIATIPSVQVVRALAQTHLDFLIIDMEHGPIDPCAAHAMITAAAGTRLVPLVRVAATSTEHAKLPLDLGAMGICFPMTTRVEDACAGVRAVHYPPEGERFWGPFYASMQYGMSLRDYQDVANKEVMTIGTIEHVNALNNIEDVAATPGMDLLFIGPGDLATSMGHGGRVEHPDVQSAIASLENAILASPTKLGGVATTAENVQRMKARGYRALVVGFDWSLLQQGVASIVRSKAGPPLANQ